jgi:hypothetical protein
MAELCEGFLLRGKQLNDSSFAEREQIGEL